MTLKTQDDQQQIEKDKTDAKWPQKNTHKYHKDTKKKNHQEMQNYQKHTKPL